MKYSKTHKKHILFVGSFKSKCDDGSVGGQMFACNSLIDSELSESYKWTLLDTTATTNKHRTFITRLFPALKRILISIYHIIFSKIDVVLVFASANYSFIEKGIIVKLAKLFGKKTVIAPRSGLLIDEVKNSSFFKKIVSSILRDSNVIICQGSFWQSFFHSEFKVPNNKLKVVHNWIKIEEHKTSRLNNDKVVFLFIGWIVDYKGVFDIVEAVREIDRNDFIIYFAGGGSAYNKLIKKINKYNLRDKIIPLGWSRGEKKKELFMNSDVLIAPSHREGFPNVLLEAMTFKIPAIASDVGGVPDIINNLENGYLIKPKDIDAIKKGITYYLDNKNSIAAHGENAFETIKKHNSIDIAVEKFNNIFNSLYEKQTKN